MIKQSSNNKSKFIYILGLIVFVVSATYLWKASVSKPAIDNTVVATISDRSITVDDLQKKMLLRSGGATQYFASQENKQALINEMIQREVQITRALELGYADDPDIIKSLENLKEKRQKISSHSMETGRRLNIISNN